jgi:hypothetical protein
MKSTIKLLGIIAVIAVIGFSMAGCQETIPEGDTITGTVKASPEGEIVFGYTVDVSGPSLTCSITIVSSGSNKAFPVHSEYEKTISKLEPNEVVYWTATVERGFLFLRMDDNGEKEVRLCGAMHE